MPARTDNTPRRRGPAKIISLWHNSVESAAAAGGIASEQALRGFITTAWRLSWRLLWPAKRRETFADATRRLGLTEADLELLQTRLERQAFLTVLLAVGLAVGALWFGRTFAGLVFWILSLSQALVALVAILRRRAVTQRRLLTLPWERNRKEKR